MSIPAEHLARLQNAGVTEEPTPVPAAPEQLELPAPDPAVEELKTQNKALMDRLDRQERLVTETLKAAQRPVVVNPPTDTKEPDWDNMTTKDIVQSVIGEVRKGHVEMAQSFGFELAKIRLEGQIERAIEKYPDFLKYGDEIVELTKTKNGQITPVEAYTLVKARHTEETSEKEETDKKEKSKSGVVPTSQRSGAKPPPAPKDIKEAATRAYNEVFGKRG